MIQVVAAKIEMGDRFLLFRRPPNKTRGLKWEFPGGKVENGESPEDALIRECQEELDIAVRIVGRCARITHAYPDVTIDLMLMNCCIESGSPILKEHIAVRAVTKEEAEKLNLAEADRLLLQQINSESYDARLDLWDQGAGTGIRFPGPK